MSELLFELGCEELPASFVKKAYQQLEREITSRLRSSDIEFGASQSMGTPRRLIVQVQNVVPQQPDSIKTQKGPSLKAAYDDKGNPTKALIGFCKSQGIELEDLIKQDEYVWANKKVLGRPTAEILATLLPEAVRAITFDKSMRWGTSRMRFARPIRWMLACYNKQLIPFQVENVSSNLESRGHRFKAPSSFVAHTLDELTTQLRDHFVEPDPHVREMLIRKETASVASGLPMLPDELVEENVFLTEWPSALEGTFPKEYLELPESVLVTAMAKHQRFFPVYGAECRLLNKFISIRNGGAEETVRAGNEWVLMTRFKDADFFYQQDIKKSMDYFLEQTVRITFQDKLGTVRQRADRLSQLCEYIAQMEGEDPQVRQLAQKAGLYCKADLSSGLVSELPELQGVVGAEYATKQGSPEFPLYVSLAISSHYNIQSALESAKESNNISIYVLVADQLDKLAGYLGINLAPSGSSDPYGLRRAVSYLIWSNYFGKHPKMSYLKFFEKALELYENQGFQLNARDALNHIEALFLSRYRALIRVNKEGEFSYADPSQADATHTPCCELIDGTFSEIKLPQLLDPASVLMRLRILHTSMADVQYKGFIQAATRTINIVQAAKKKDILPDLAHYNWSVKDLESESGVHLYQAFDAQKGHILDAVEHRNADQLLKALLLLEKPIHEFFESTLVMAEDEKVRNARLILLSGIAELILFAGDFSRVNPSE